MNTAAARRQSGFTLLEAMIVISGLLLALLVATTTYGSASDVARQSQLHMQVHAENRRSLEVLAKVLREADAQSLAGFDASGWAATVAFERVRGAGLEDRVLRPEEEMRWESSSYESGLNLELGEVWLVSGAERRVLARRVPRDGFRAVRTERTLLLHLTTCSHVHEGEIVHVHGRTAIAVRN